MLQLQLQWMLLMLLLLLQQQLDTTTQVAGSAVGAGRVNEHKKFVYIFAICAN